MRQSRRHAADAAGARQARRGQYACRLLRCAVILLLAAVLCGAETLAGVSDRGCGSLPNPPFGPLGAPHVAVWRDGDPHSALQAPACLDWTAWGSTVVVALAGRFTGPDSDESLLFSASSPSFFPSIVGGISVAESLLGVIVAQEGKGVVQRIEAAERQLFESGSYEGVPGPRRRGGRDRSA